MRHFVFCSLAILLALATHAQNFEGQWKGSFTALDSSEIDDYVLELQPLAKNEVSGYSYTYFYVAGQHYFTICRVSGTIDRASKTVTVTEVERVKGNMPPGMQDCLQTHILTYYKGPDSETLEGRWRPAPGFDHGCGFGTTTLTRATLTSLHITRKPAPRTPATRTPAPRRDTAGLAAAKPAPRKPAPSVKKPAAPAAAGKAPAKTAGAPKPAGAAKPGVGAPGKNTLARNDTATLRMQPGGDRLSGPPPVSVTVTPPPPQVRQRGENVIQTIALTSPEIKIELYDDGIIDHDTVTVYFNGKAVVYKAMLKREPIKVTLTALPDRDNDLILYADNLGDIPPNTALMIVHAGEEQYDVRVTSDLEHNGVVRFRLKGKAP
jgi:hypothetical protein